MNLCQNDKTNLHKNGLKEPIQQPLQNKVRIPNDATSFFLSVDKHRPNFQQYHKSCSVCTGWSTWKLPWKRLKHQKLDTYRWKGPCVLFDRTNKIHPFLHLTLTANKVSCLHYLQRNTLCLADFGHLKRRKSYLYNFVSQFLTENLCILEPFFSCRFAYRTMDFERIF